MEILGSVIGAGINADASRHAANTQADSQRDALNLQRDQYNQTRQDNLGQIKLGQSATERLARLYGLTQPETRDQIRARLLPQYSKAATVNNRLSPMDGYGQDKGLFGMNGAAGFYGPNIGTNMPAPASPTIDEAGLNAAIDAEMAKQPQGAGTPDFNSLLGLDPGYQFRLQQGTKGLNMGAASRGGYFSGAALKGLTDYNSNLASQEFSNADNRLKALAGFGQTANNQTSQAGMNFANQGGNYLSNMGDARASGYIGQSNALMNGLDSIYGAYKKWNTPAPNNPTAPSASDLGYY